jgi:PAS domain S-box-containing protein
LFVAAATFFASKAFMPQIIDLLESGGAARELELRFRATFEQAAVGIAHVGVDGRWLRVNRKLCEIVGYSHDELMRRTFQDITHPDDLAADLANVQKLLRRELDTYVMEKRYLRNDGSIVWVNLTVSLVRDDGDQPSFFIAVVEDISAKKLAEQRFLMLADALPQIVWEAGPDGQLDYYNRKWYELVGAETGIMDWLPYLHPDDQQRCLEQWQECLGAGKPLEIEFRIRTASGAYPRTAGTWGGACRIAMRRGESFAGMGLAPTFTIRSRLKPPCARTRSGCGWPGRQRGWVTLNGILRPTRFRGHRSSKRCTGCRPVDSRAGTRTGCD